MMQQNQFTVILFDVVQCWLKWA